MAVPFIRSEKLGVYHFLCMKQIDKQPLFSTEINLDVVPGHDLFKMSLDRIQKLKLEETDVMPLRNEKQLRRFVCHLDQKKRNGNN